MYEVVDDKPVTHSDSSTHRRLLLMSCRLVQEYCDCGTLGGIVGEWEPSEENEQRMLLRLLLLQDCAQGLKVLHSRHVVHGDLVRFSKMSKRMFV